jgi:hypothetical protein
MSIQTSIWRYAIIALRNEPQQERLVISSKEKELRNLFTAPGIVTLGYSSREEALANIERCLSAPAFSIQASKIGIVDTVATLLKEVCAVTRRLGNFRSVSTWTIGRNLYQYSFASAIRFMYSRNILSSTVRAFISF